MKLLVINPNTNEKMTSEIKSELDLWTTNDLIVDVITNGMGVSSVEGYTDEAISTIGILEIIVQKQNDYDGFLIACYSNHPAIHCARELMDKPVIGILEASVWLGCLLGHKFSIVTTSKRWVPMLEEAVVALGIKSRLASVRSTGLSVLDLTKISREKLAQHLQKECEIAIKNDGAEVICLGCAGMAGMSGTMTELLNIPVIDGVSAGVKLLAILGELGYKTSKVCKYQFVEPREVLNISHDLKLIYQQD